MKAAFLYNFTRFVDWSPVEPACGPRPLVIGVLGTDPFGSLLDDAMSGKTVGRRALEVRRLLRPTEAEPCSILFIASSEHSRLREILPSLQGKPVLTVGDSDDFTAAGGMIGLFVADRRVGFEVNLEAAALSGIVLSSRLLTLGRIRGRAPSGQER